jgi:heme a synthase
MKSSVSVGFKPKAKPECSLTPVIRWLWICAALVFAMAIIGAITRLTESGLSIVHWKPFGGAIPPLNEADWQALFAEYKGSPQYQQVNRGMSLAEFQGIFWWEWIHRQWGRLIGLAFALPLIWFTFTRRVSGPLLYKLCGLLVLGGLQAFMGWYMVASGLDADPSVSHYRLAAHLSLATLIMALLITLALKLADNRPWQLAPSGIRAHARIGFALLAITLVWGAFVAGLDAGQIYNEFPHMGGTLFPAEGLDLKPLWLNFFENHATVQFTHRWLAVLTAFVIFALGLEAVRSPNTSARAKRIGKWLMLMVWVQVALGITTLLTHVHLHVAATHQAGALILIGLMTMMVHELRRSP